MAQDPSELYVVPRNFKLMDELEQAEKGMDKTKYGEDTNWITLGLSEETNKTTKQNHDMKHWNASIIPHQGKNIGDRLYSLHVVAGPDYPSVPPLIKFVEKVDMPCVNREGVVQIGKIPHFQWSEHSTIFEALVYLRRAMEPTHIAQACARINPNLKY